MFNKKIIYMALVIISIVAMMTGAFNRLSVEQKAKSVEFTLDYSQMVKLADQSDKSLNWWFNKFNDLGVQSVSIEQETFKSIKEDGKDIQYEVVSNIVQEFGWENQFSSNVVQYIKGDESSETDLIVQTSSDAIGSFIHESLKKRYPEDMYFYDESIERHVFVIEGSLKEIVYSTKKRTVDAFDKGYTMYKDIYTSKLERLPLDFDPEKVSNIQESGLSVVARPMNYVRNNDQLLSSYIDEVSKYDIAPNYFIFSGKSVVSYDGTKYNPDLVEYMKREKIAPVLIETGVQRSNSKQDGLNDLVSDMNYEAIRLFSLAEYMQLKYQAYGYQGSEEIENIIYRAVTERNIRLVYFRPFMFSSNTYVTNPQEYERLFTSLNNRLQQHDMHLGEASVYTNNSIGILSLVFISYGIFMLGLLIIKDIVPLSSVIEYVIIIAALIFIPIGYYLAVNAMALLMALLATLIFSSYAIMKFVNTLKKVYCQEGSMSLISYCVEFIQPLCIVLIGGVFVGTILSSSEYLLEMRFFRGVKISQMLPLLFFVVIWLLKFGYKEDFQTIAKTNVFIKDIKKLLFEDIKVIYVLIGVLFAGVGYYYLARTGHETNIQPSTFEMLMRNMLEMNLLARPRTKEFLIAFPCIMLAYYFASRRYKYFMALAALAASMGLGSVLNTFSHLRTPLYLSIHRTIYAVLFGAVLGIIYIQLFRIAEKVYNIVKKKVMYV